MADGMVERVARAIWVNPAKCDLRNVSQGPCSLGDECSCWPAMQKVARAAIAALRAPTPAMLKAPDSIMGGGWQNTHSDLETWEAMIDAALGEPPA